MQGDDGDDHDFSRVELQSILMKDPMQSACKLSFQPGKTNKCNLHVQVLQVVPAAVLSEVFFLVPIYWASE